MASLDLHVGDTYLAISQGLCSGCHVDVLLVTCYALKEATLVAQAVKMKKAFCFYEFAV
jgi:hypothetical protein